MKKTNQLTEIYKARTIGSLFLLAFIAYGLGRHFFESEVVFKEYIVTTLIIANSIMVLFIGILLRKTLQLYSPLIGNIYLFTRVFESIALASIVLNLVPTINISYDHGYFLGMLCLGLGSIPMCLTFYKHMIIPPWLAIFGIVGYALLSFGFLMEFFGKTWSMYLLIPGGLWEVIFAIWLITSRSLKLE